MSVRTAQLGDICITTKVLPASEVTAAVPGVGTTNGQIWTNVTPQKKKFPAKALSPVLILIGVLQLSLGASLAAAEITSPSLVVRSGVYLWGGLVFIATGVITVVTATKESIIRIKVCLVSHIINASVAAIGILLYALQLYTETQACWVNKEEHGHSNRCISINATEATEATEAPNDWHYHHYYYTPDMGYVLALRVGVISMVFLYMSLGLIISSCAILLRWKSLKESKYSLL